MWGVLSDGRTSLSFTIAAGLASAVILGSESRGTHVCILLSQIRDSPNLENQVPVFISPRNSVAQLYPQALVSLFVTELRWRYLNLPPRRGLDVWFDCTYVETCLFCFVFPIADLAEDTEMHYVTYSVLLPICMVATIVKVLWLRLSMWFEFFPISLLNNWNLIS
jgi:hypothetical protein